MICLIYIIFFVSATSCDMFHPMYLVLCGRDGYLLSKVLIYHVICPTPGKEKKRKKNFHPKVKCGGRYIYIKNRDIP